MSFNIENSKAGSSTIADFVRTDDLAQEEVSVIPGVGDATQAALSDNGINTIGQLLGHFLTFDNGARDAQAVCNQMYSFLEENDVGRANKHSIVHALAELADYKKLFKFDL